MTQIARLLGHMTAHRTIEADTLGLLIPLFADVNQFRDPAAALDRAATSGMSNPEAEEILAGEVTLAMTIFPATPVGRLGSDTCLPDIPERFNDAANFDIRVPGITGATLPYLDRCEPTLAREVVRGIATVETLRACPGFAPLDILGAALQCLKGFTVMSDCGVLFLHSVQDMHESASALHRDMADQLRFARMHPEFKVTTFSRIGPLAGTLAGIIPAGSGWPENGDFFEIETDYEVDPVWWDNIQGKNPVPMIN